MAVYLVRHTKPLVEKGICYGQTDLDVADSFVDEWQQLLPHLPASPAMVVSSPLQRCTKLAQQLFPTHTLALDPHLMEINCGDWEMKHWDELPRDITEAWMKDFVRNPFPNGENYLQLYDRVIQRFLHWQQQTLPLVLIAHGGVIRSILSHITQTPLADSFRVFPLHYGCVIKIETATVNSWQYATLYNQPPEVQEQHRPS